jgi:hypothetical protein
MRQSGGVCDSTQAPPTASYWERVVATIAMQPHSQNRPIKARCEDEATPPGEELKPSDPNAGNTFEDEDESPSFVPGSGERPLASRATPSGSPLKDPLAVPAVGTYVPADYRPLSAVVVDALTVAVG